MPKLRARPACTAITHGVSWVSPMGVPVPAPAASSPAAAPLLHFLTLGATCCTCSWPLHTLMRAAAASQLLDAAAHSMMLQARGSRAPAHAVTGDQAQLRPVLQEHIACCLGGVDAHTIICDDRAGLCWHLELLSCELQHRRKWCLLWHAEYTVWKLWV
eukprot:CAMPEP_0202869274 /NCGR_PEP_ID=MMETSP1391-20130828/12327_1 /ASSEMBLY_ACC=CAM_ASM_000867 /TAXON_ID=1034604 /ORGANISM="Chlamydomonas leiostraca, Strain SAG 11-49" /LENGTH=158 /DNA_ID=CAMNT_0049549579 /DNA_START=567 /DNA_END=1044 /DNA_ORIENTATION=+